MIAQHGESRSRHASEGVLMQAIFELARASECARSTLRRTGKLKPVDQTRQSAPRRVPVRSSRTQGAVTDTDRHSGSHMQDARRHPRIRDTRDLVASVRSVGRPSRIGRMS